MSVNNPEPSPFIANSYLNGEPFKYQVYFWNSDDRVMRINTGAIKELVLDDNILEWYHSGHIIFTNTKDVFERVTKKYSQGNEVDVVPYRFRNDGRDYIFIEIDVPVEDDIKSNLSLNNEVFTIKLTFSATQVEDVIMDDGEKCKKIYFWDYRQQIFAERNLCWSSPLALKRQTNIGIFKSLYLVDEPEASVYTGDAIKDIITESLKTTKTTPKFEKDFSRGGEKFFYTSPTDSKAYDDLIYILKHHVHDTESMQPCILRCNRFTDEWSLLPIGEYYKRVHTPTDDGPGFPGPMLRDKFYIADESQPPPGENVVLTNKARTSPHHTALNNFWIPQNTINSFEFYESSNLDCMDVFNTSIVSMYEGKNKQFNIHQHDSDIENVRKYMKDTVFSTLLAGDGGADPSFVLNQTKIQNKSYKSFFSPVATKCRENLEGRNRIIMDGIMRGNTLKFTARGMPSRQAGMFISVDRRGGFNENEFDDKILGYHLTVSVRHIIKNSSYSNEIISVKPYRWQSGNFNEEKE